MIIKLSDRNIPGSVEEQFEKVIEEFREFAVAYAYRRTFGDVMPELCPTATRALAEETFDVMEALTRLLTKVGIDIKEANARHLEKMKRREKAYASKTIT